MVQRVDGPDRQGPGADHRPELAGVHVNAGGGGDDHDDDIDQVRSGAGYGEVSVSAVSCTVSASSRIAFEEKVA